jgi:ribonuclease HI
VTEWLATWKANDWRKSKSSKSNRTVLNQDLWTQLDKLIEGHKVGWSWVKGHADDQDNLRCDQLANKSAREQLASSGVIRIHDTASCTNR